MMNIHQFLSILWARRWLALTVFLVTVGATAIVSLLLPKKYTASSAIVIEMKGDPIVGMLFQNMGAASYMGTQVDIFNSDRVARRVVTNLRLNENAEIRQQWLEETQGQGSFESWLANMLKGGLTVLPSRESSLINVSYTARDPAFAAGMANGFVQAYLDTALDLRVDPARQYSTFFDSRAKELRDQLEQAQTKLSAYQKANGIIATDERLDIETSRLNELSSQLVALQAIASNRAAAMPRPRAPAETASRKSSATRSSPASAAISRAPRRASRSSPRAWAMPTRRSSKPGPTSPSCAPGWRRKPAASPAASASRTPSIASANPRFARRSTRNAPRCCA
jgi:uncharacterized protein involved in exopolysaccharide biosynthesis